MDKYNVKVIINKELTSTRLDKVLTNRLNSLSRNQVKILVKNGNVKKDGKLIYDPSYITKFNEIYLVKVFFETKNTNQPEDINLNIVYEDEDLIVVNKPSNLVVHPAPGNTSGTLVNALIYHTKNKLSNTGSNDRPGIVHRLDKDTSGILVVAKNNQVHEELSKQFKNHSITRKYKAIVWGVPNKQIIEGYIERNKKNRKKMSLNNKGYGKYSKTEINLIDAYEIASLIDCKLYTGRTHQIRLHLTSINSNIVGDKLYGRSKINQFGKNQKTFNKFLILKNFERQALHAYHLGFYHPTLKKMMEFNVDLPEDFKNLLNLLVKY